jgi:hypothetical protein
LSETDDDAKTWLALRALDASDVVAMDPRAQTKFLLRKTSLDSQRTQRFTEAYE